MSSSNSSGRPMDTDKLYRTTEFEQLLGLIEGTNDGLILDDSDVKHILHRQKEEIFQILHPLFLQIDEATVSDGIDNQIPGILNDIFDIVENLYCKCKARREDSERSINYQNTSTAKCQVCEIGNQKVDELEHQLTEAQHTIKRSTQNTHLLEKQLNTKTRELEELKEQFEIEKANLDEHKDQWVQKKLDLASQLRQVRTEAQEEVAQEVEKSKVAEQKLLQVTNDCKRYEYEMQQLQQDNKMKEEVNLILTQQVQELETMITKKSETTQDIEQELDDERDEKQKATVAMQEVEQQLDDERAEKQKIQKELDEIQKQVQTLESRNLKLLNQIRSTGVQIKTPRTHAVQEHNISPRTPRIPISSTRHPLERTKESMDTNNKSGSTLDKGVNLAKKQKVVIAPLPIHRLHTVRENDVVGEIFDPVSRNYPLRQSQEKRQDPNVSRQKSNTTTPRLNEFRGARDLASLLLPGSQTARYSESHKKNRLFEMAELNNR